MTSFDELIGPESAGAERERLQRVHELLLEAGPPPELTPELEKGPTLAMTLSRVRSFSRRRRALILTTAAAVLFALIIGISSGLHGNKYPTITLRGTGSAFGATGRLELLPPKKDGTQPMKLEVAGLPPLGKVRYVVYLVRNGRRVASCGSFTVSKADVETTVRLVSPYRRKAADTWIITVKSRLGDTLTVMQPIT